MRRTINKATLIGAGNVGHHLAIALSHAGIDIVQVFSRTIEKARGTTSIAGGEPIDRLDALTYDVDLLLIAAKDAAIPDIIGALKREGNAIIAHTSGSTPLSMLSFDDLPTGVFYPLQTFSRERTLKTENIPFCIEGSDKRTAEALYHLASSISDHVRYIDSDQRKMLHIAAVFACNFTNHLYKVAGELLEKENMDLSMLFALMEETLMKVREHPPGEVQTGPAKRNDKAIIQEHLNMLSEDPEKKALYEALTNHILMEYHGDEL